MAKPIVDLCRDQQVTYEQLVERSGLDENKVQAIFLGRWTPSPKERQAIAAVFGVEVGEIVWGHVTPVQHVYGNGPQ